MKKEMKKIYHVYDCGDFGDIEGMFDEKNKLLGCWSNNDGDWRNEYFSPFMKKLGILIVNVKGGTPLWQELVKKLQKEFDQ